MNETSAQKSEESTLKSYYNKDLEIFNSDNKDLNNATNNYLIYLD